MAKDGKDIEAAEHSLRHKISRIVQRAPAPADGFPFQYLDEFLEVIVEVGRVTTALRMCGIQPKAFNQLLEDAESGTPEAVEAVKQIDQAIAIFEGQTISHLLENPHNALIKFLERTTPDDWMEGGSGDEPQQQGNVTIVMPSNGREAEPKAIDVEVVEEPESDGA